MGGLCGGWGRSGTAGLSRPFPASYRGLAVILRGRREPWPPAPCHSRRGSPHRRTAARAPAARRSSDNSRAPPERGGRARQPGRAPPRRR